MQVLRWLGARLLIGVGTLAAMVAMVAMIKFWVFFWRHCPAAGAVVDWLFR